MKRVAVLTVLALAVCVQSASPASAQDWRHPTPAVAPAAPQESPQTVKAAIPVQAPRPTGTTPVPAQGRPGEGPQPDRPQGNLMYKPPSEVEPVNVRLDVTITYQVGTSAPVKRSATVTVADQGRGSLRSGVQVAVPETQFVPTQAATPAPRAESGSVAPAATAPSPMTSFRYRSVGLNVDANRVAIVGNKARMELSVEFSAIDEKAEQGGKPGSSPSFPTFSQNLTVVLESGKPIVIAQTSDVADNVERKQSVEVKATILR